MVVIDAPDSWTGTAPVPVGAVAGMRHGAHRALAALVLAPVAGPWRDGEVLARHPVAGDADPGEAWSSLLSGRPLPSSAGG